MKKPTNIILIFTDQHLKSTLGCYGNKDCQTPNLDRIAANGTIFDNAYTTSPICTPARASVQTGLYPFKHGMQTNIFMHGCMIHELRDCPELLSRRLESASYAPYYTGKWHLGYGKETLADPYYQENYLKIDSHLYDIEYPDLYRETSSLPTTVGYQGDDFPGHGGGGHAYPQYLKYQEDLGMKQETTHHGGGKYEVTSPVETTIDYFLTERAKHWIDEGLKQEKPYFLMLNYWGPHSPYYVPTKFVNQYKDTAIPPWPSFEEDQTHKPRIHVATRNTERDWEYIQEDMRFYYGYVSYLDWEIGRILEHLEQTGTLDNTVIIFSSDHGDSMGIHHGLFNKSIHMYEPTNTISLMVWDPRESGGKRAPNFANLTDIYSTILDLAGVPEEQSKRHGRSLMPLVRGEDVSNWPEAVVTEGSGIQHLLITQRAIRKGNLKYVFNTGDLEELYDLEMDPEEMRNLAVEPEFAKDLQEMRQALADWMLEKGDRLIEQYERIFPVKS